MFLTSLLLEFGFKVFLCVIVIISMSGSIVNFFTLNDYLFIQLNAFFRSQVQRNFVIFHYFNLVSFEVGILPSLIVQLIRNLSIDFDL
jgi:hypothetical protein